MTDEKRYQTIAFAVERYHWNNTLEQAREDMWNDIGKFLYLLTKNDYIAVVYDDDVDVIIVQYEHNEKVDPWGVANPEWVTEDEMWSIQSLEDELLDEKHKEVDDDE